MLIDFAQFEVWFVTGSQHLYGPETLKQVAEDSQKIVDGLNQSGKLPIKLVYKPTAKTPDEISSVCRDASASDRCIGVIFWCHTFSPAKMWINGLRTLTKPYLHLHTQFNRDIPWATIDMDFMNLNQSAHGDREFGFICTRLRQNRKVVVGHWQEKTVQEEVGSWQRVAAALQDLKTMKVARFGDNMREVAVTEGDKVEAQIRMGVAVNGYGIGDLVKYVDQVSDADAKVLCDEYDSAYRMAKELGPKGARRDSLMYSAKIELGMRRFLKEGNFGAFTTTFEDLYGLQQLPGMAVQRLMNDGYGFGAEGDWKHAALVRCLKVMGAGLKGGCSFMEDYTYHLDPKGAVVLGAHMLEICPSIAGEKPACEIHPLGIGGKADPLRLVFAAAAGKALNATLIDMGNRLRMIVNEVDVIKARPLPKLPVARVLWKPQPDLKTAAAAWIYAGGAHHTAFSQAVTSDQIEVLADMLNIECVFIDARTELRRFRQELRWNAAYYGA